LIFIVKLKFLRNLSNDWTPGDNTGGLRILPTGIIASLSGGRGFNLSAQFVKYSVVLRDYLVV